MKNKQIVMLGILSLILIVTINANFSNSVKLPEHHSPPTAVIEQGSGVEAASYIIFRDNEGIVYAKNGSTGAIDYSGTNASQVIQSAIDALTNGGLVFVKAGTYSLSNPIIFSQGSYVTKEWVLTGEGISTKLLQTSGGLDAIVVKNNTRVSLTNFYISVGSNAGNGIFLDNSVDGEYSMRRGRISDVHIEGGNSNKYLLYMINPMSVLVERLRLSSTTTVPLRILENSTTINYGNSEFIGLEIYTQGKNGMEIDSSTSKLMNLLSFTSVYISNGGSSANTIGIRLGNNTNYNMFKFVDIEGFDIGILLNGSSGKDTTGNIFEGGYIGANIYGINSGYYTAANKFMNLKIYLPTGQTAAIKDEQQYRNPNVYEDMLWSGTLNVTINAANPPRPIFRGRAGGQYFSNSGMITATNGTWVTHGLVTTPNIVQLTSTAFNVSTYLLATNSSHFQIGLYYTTTGTNVTSATNVTWYAEV